jgi:hypothetical protein
MLPYKSSSGNQMLQRFSGWWYPMVQENESAQYQEV